MSENKFQEYWQKIDGRSNEGGTFYNELKKLFDENKALKESRDELLNALEYIHKRIENEDFGLPCGMVKTTIQSAQALKEEETK